MSATGDLTSNPVTWLGIQPVTFQFPASTQSTEPHQPGHPPPCFLKVRGQAMYFVPPVRMPPGGPINGLWVHQENNNSSETTHPAVQLFHWSRKNCLPAQGGKKRNPCAESILMAISHFLGTIIKKMALPFWAHDNGVLKKEPWPENNFTTNNCQWEK